MPNQYTKNPTPSTQRFWALVNKNGPVPEYAPHLGPCWLWLAHTSSEHYGHFKIGGRPTLAHRWAYKTLVGPIPEGLQIDHLCRVRHCVNPEHMEPVTPLVNTRRGETGQKNARKTHCPLDHPYDDKNTRRNPRGDRICRQCHREDEQRRRDRALGRKV